VVVAVSQHWAQHRLHFSSKNNWGA